MPKKRASLKNRSLVPTIQPEQDFSWTCGFREVLDDEINRFRRELAKSNLGNKNRKLFIFDP